MNDYIFLFVGVGLIVIGIILIIRANHLKSHGIVTNGIIQDFFSVPNDNGGRTYYPIVKFSVKDGVIVTEKHSLGFSFKLYKKGSSVRVIYDPNNYSKFFIDSTLNRVLCYALATIGGAFCIISLIRIL